MALTPICSVHGCGKPARSRGWCPMHYARWIRRGDLGWHRPKHFCSVEGCESPVKGNRLCNRHYKRAKNYGSPDKRSRAANGDVMRWILAHVTHKGGACLIFPFGRAGTGYGVIRPSLGLPTTGAHREMCRLAHGEPPSALHIAIHSCGKGHEGCVNPMHLHWGTHKENTSDMWQHGTVVLGESHKGAKLSERDVRDIRALRGIAKHAELANRFGVSRSHIYNIQTRRSWSWLP